MKDLIFVSLLSFMLTSFSTFSVGAEEHDRAVLEDLEAASTQGNADAMNDLAVHLLKGGEEYERAIKLLEADAAKGHWIAKVNLGRRYEIGLGVAPDSGKFIL